MILGSDERHCFQSPASEDLFGFSFQRWVGAATSLLLSYCLGFLLLILLAKFEDLHTNPRNREILLLVALFLRSRLPITRKQSHSAGDWPR